MGVTPLYSADKPAGEAAGGARETMNVAVFGSGSGTNLLALLKAERYIEQMLGKKLFSVRAIFCDRKCNCMEIGRLSHIPVLYHSFKRFFEDKDRRDRSAREQYDQHTLNMLQQLANEDEFTIDLIALAGYMRIVFSPLLQAFPDRIVNVHPADLSVKGDDGKRLYPGDKAVLKAIVAGETHTYSTVHILTEGVDEGEVLVRSNPLNVDSSSHLQAQRILTQIVAPEIAKMKGRTSENLDVYLANFKEKHPELFAHLAEFADAHQNEQKRQCDWPAYVAAVTLIAQGRVAIDEARTIYLDGKPTESGSNMEELLLKGKTDDIAADAAQYITREGI